MTEFHLIRHAESEANIADDLDNPTHYFDAKITEKGRIQAKNTYEELKDIDFDLYVCSPLTRTLETFSIVFPKKTPYISDLIREHLYHSCDVGRQPSVLKKEFPKFDFDSLGQYWWNNNKPLDNYKIIQETYEDIKIRLDKFKDWVKTKDVNKVAVVSHGTFLGQITGRMLENCERFIWKL